MSNPGRIFIPGLLCLFFNFSTAQKASIDQYNNAVNEMTLANKQEQDAKGTTDAEAARKCAKAFKKAGDDFLAIKNVFPELTEKNAYYSCYCYYHAAEEFYNAKSTSDGDALILQVLVQWPQLNDIPFKKLVKESNVKSNGKNYTVQVAVSETEWYNLFYSVRVYAAKLSYEKKSYADAISFADMVIASNDQQPLMSAMAADYAAKASHAIGKDGKSADYAITGLEKAGMAQATTSDEKGKYKDVVNSLLKSIQSSAAVDAVFAERAAIALDPVSKYDVNLWLSVKKYGDFAYSKGQNSLQLVFALADAARNLRNDDEARKWADVLEIRRGEFNRNDYNRLAVLYKYLGDGNMAGKSMRRGKRYENRKNTHVALATNPVNFFFWNQYPVSLTLIRPNTSQEIRVNYVVNSPYVILKSTVDTSGRFLYLYYSGYEVSYSIRHNFKNLGSVKWLFPYIGTEFRYSYRQFSAENIQYVTDSNNFLRNFPQVTSTSMAGDITINFGQNLRYKWFFADMYGGVGIGYKTLTTSTPIFNNPYITITDDRFTATRWNKPYLPIRLGFRIGFVL